MGPKWILEGMGTMGRRLVEYAKEKITSKFAQNDRTLHVLPLHTGDLPLITHNRRMYEYHNIKFADNTHEQRLYA